MVVARTLASCCGPSALSVTSSGFQVEVTGGASGTSNRRLPSLIPRVGVLRSGHPFPHALLLASVVLLLLLFVASSALSVLVFVFSERADLTTEEVIGASDELLMGLLNAETGQRGYLLTSNPVFLQPYDTALSTVPADRRLGSLAASAPGGGQYFAELNSLVATKMAVIADTINLARR